MLRLMEHFEIEVVGQLDHRRAGALGCGRIRHLPSGNSVLTFAAIDPTALYGLIACLRDAGVALVAVRRVRESTPGATARTMHER